MKKQPYPTFSTLSKSKNSYPTIQDLVDVKATIINNAGKLLIEASGLPVKQWIKTNELGKFLGMSSGTLQTLRNNGTLPFTRMGGVIYYDVDAILKMLEQHKENIL